MGFTRDIPTPLNIPNTVPKRDENSEFAVTKIHGDLDGNAKTSDDGLTTVQGSNGLTLVLSNKTLTASLDSNSIGGKLKLLLSGSQIGERSGLNLIPGTNTSITAVDNAANDRLDVTINATGGLTDAATIGSGSGSAIFKQKNGTILEFRKINAASNKISVGIDGTDGVGIDVVPGNIDHQTLSGAGVLNHSEIDVILSDLSPTDAQSLDGQALSIYNTTTVLYSGYLTQGATAYQSGVPAGSNVSYILKDATFNLQTPNTTTAINKGDQGSLDLYVNGTLVDSFDLVTPFNESLRNTSQTYPSTAGTSTNGMITIVSVDKYNSFRAYQKVVARVNVTPSMLVDGYNTIQLQHNLSTPQNSTTFSLFYDTDAGANPSITVPTLTNLSQTSSKYLSGIRFASTNDTIDLGVVGSNLFNNVYHNQPITYSGLTGVVNDVVAVTDGAVTGVSNPPARGQTMTVANKTLTFVSTNVCSNSGRITCTPRDPYGSYTAQTSAAQNLLVSTYGTGNSNDRNEFFRDETYRLPLTYDFTATSGGYTGQWTSSTALSNGNAQVYFASAAAHGLVYPTINFTSGYVPAQSGRNYSTFTGNQVYARAFVPTSNKTGVTVTLGGVAGGIGTVGLSDLNIEVKLPSQTGWLDAARAYDSSAGVGSDGLGCLSGSISYSGGNAVFTLTFGGKSTGDAGGRMYMRVTLRNGNRSMTSITTNW